MINQNMSNSVKDNLLKVRNTLPNNVSLVAVSKYQPVESILEAYECGQRVFAESHVQELSKKYNTLPKDIEWHFIGHLQTNKVKYIVPYISLIESVDSIHLLKEINKQSRKCNRIVDVLLELHIAEEETKTGFEINECKELFENCSFADFESVRICGIMMMASNVDDYNQIKQEFKLAQDFFNFIKSNYYPQDDYFAICSWGMSNDYLIAIDNGSNNVRVGSLIFGSR